MSENRITLPTWGGRKMFQYDGSVAAGTTVYCGVDFAYSYRVEAEEYAAMIDEFAGQEVTIGTSRSDPPRGSLGEWFTERFNQYGMTSYVGPILIKEGYAARGSQQDKIRFHPSGSSRRNSK